jgi:hypothetical protein
MTSLLILVALMGCSKDPSSPEPRPSATNVNVESARRETAVIGTGGGSVSATSSSGITYTLDIPANALAGDVEIAITPVASIANLPFTGTLEGAARLEPSGLRLLTPGRLTIAKAPTAGAELLLGFSYEGDADTYQAAGAIDAATEIQVLVSHFSGAGAATGSAADGNAWVAEFCASTSGEHPFHAKIGNCYPGEPVDRREWFLQYARDYLAYVVTPFLNDVDPTVGVAEYLEWYYACDAFAADYNADDWITALEGELLNVKVLMAAKLITAVTEAKSQLCAQGGIERLRTIFEYRHLALAAGLEDVVGLQESDVLAGLCAEIVIAEQVLADPLPAGSDQSLDARAELRINGQAEDANFEFTLLLENATCLGSSSCGGRSNGLGEYTAVVRRSSYEPVSITVVANLMLPLFQIIPGGGTGYALAYTPLLGTTNVTRGGWTLVADLPTVLVPGDPAELTATAMQWEYNGGTTPLSNALISFSVSGGTANPISAFTDNNGNATTQITANMGSSEVVVTSTASFGGVQIGSVITSRGVSYGNPVLTFLSRASHAFATAGKMIGTDAYCPPPITADQSELLAEGSFTFSHSRNFLCPNPNTGTLSADASCSGRSDPGFNSGDSHGTINFNTDIIGSVQGRTGVVMAADGGHTFDLRFQVSGASIPYVATAIVGGGNTNEHLNASMTLEGGSTVFAFNMLPGDTNQTFEGTLDPGIYLFHAVQNLVVRAADLASASNNSNVQVRLGSPTARAKR